MYATVYFELIVIRLLLAIAIAHMGLTAVYLCTINSKPLKLAIYLLFFSSNKIFAAVAVFVGKVSFAVFSE